MIHLIDPGCVAPTGHHPAINAALRHECDARAVPLRLYIHARAQPAVQQAFPGAAVLESFFPYARRPEMDLFHEYDALRNLMESDLKKMRIHVGDSLVMHTAAPGHIAALAPLAEANCKTTVVLRFPADHRTESNQQAQEMGALWRETLGALPDQVRLLADNQPLAEYFQPMTKTPIAVCPVPVDWAHCGQMKWHPTVTVAYMGEFREEKGAHMLNDIVRHVRAKRPDIRWSLPSGPESQATYYDRLAAASIVLAAYNPREYAMRTTQTVVEAAGFGKPVVVTNGAWRPAGIVVSEAAEWTPRQIALAVLRAADDLSSLWWKAFEASESVRFTHNVSQFASALLQ